MIKKLLYTSLLTSSFFFISQTFCSDLDLEKANEEKMVPTSSVDSVSSDAEVKVEDSKEHSETYILRIGSAPHSKSYPTYERPDNSYYAFVRGTYEKQLQELGVPLDHILHIYYYESTVNKITNPNYRCLRTDFNKDSFIDEVTKFEFHASTEPKKERTYFDIAITDSRTTKFINPTTMKNLLSTLKIGGKLILTDINEVYPFYDSDPVSSPLKVPAEVAAELRYTSPSKKMYMTGYGVDANGFVRHEQYSLFSEDDVLHLIGLPSSSFYTPEALMRGKKSLLKQKKN